MPVDYTLAQLAAETGVTPRTVRYYVAQGLLPSPGSGPGARYTDTHLERLRLIKRLQRDHLPLAEIRSQLNRGSATDYIRSVLNEPPLAAPSSAAAPPMAAPAPMARMAFASEPQPPQPDRSQWDRVALAPDIELHIRRPLTRDQNRRVDRLLAVARELLQEDQP